MSSDPKKGIELRSMGDGGGGAALDESPCSGWSPSWQVKRN